MICVDAGVAAKWLFPEEFSSQALALLTEEVQAGERIVGPPLLPIEVSNIVRQRMIRHSITLEEARTLVSQFNAFSLSILTPDRLSDRALVVSVEYKLPAVYDAYYLALAQILGCDFWTNDQRLLTSLEGKLPFVKWIGDFRSNPQE